MSSVARGITQKIAGHACFKCGTGIHNGDGVLYLGHHWCSGCAREEAKLRYIRAQKQEEEARGAKNGNGNGDSAASASPIATLQAALGGLAPVPASGLPATMPLAGAALGVGLLVVGIVALCWTGGEGQVGPTLTLAGSVILAGVMRR